MEFPIRKHKEQIIKAFLKSSVIIIVGPTGSGKTTQVPPYLYKAYLAQNDGLMGVIEPRRIAAISAAEFVANQIGCKVGNEVGFQIRFNDSTTAGTKIKFMTDGILLQEAKSDPFFSRYKVLVFDEAHERGLNSDFLLGLVKRALTERDDLKVVVMSATLEAEKFSKFFGEAPIVRVEGRMYPVEERFITERDIEDARNLLNPKRGQESEAIAAFMVWKQMHEIPGEILVFMPGEAEIHRVLRHLEFLNIPGVKLMPAYGNMSPDEQRRIFDNITERKIVVATNVAETGITIPGLAQVYDSGLIKEMNFDHRTGISSLKIVEHSKAGLEQRKGRAGRTMPGICWRLFREENYIKVRWEYQRNWDETERPAYTKPEIQRSDLAGVVLRLAGIGIKDVESFDFIDPPLFETLCGAIKTLEAIGALTPDRNITEIGQKILNLPLEPRIGRIVLEAQRFGCVMEIIGIAAKLSVRDFFVRLKDKERDADLAKVQFVDKRSDLLTAIAVIDAYEMHGWDKRWASENFLNWKAIEEALSIRRQIKDILRELGIELTSIGYHLPKNQFSLTQEEKLQGEAIGKAVLAGFIENLARAGYRHSYYRVAEKFGEALYIHPSSVIFGDGNAEFIFAVSIVETSKTFGRDCQIVEIDWLREVAGNSLQIERTQALQRLFGHDWYVREQVLLNGRVIIEHETPATEEEIARARAAQVSSLPKKEDALSDLFLGGLPSPVSVKPGLIETRDVFLEEYREKRVKELSQEALRLQGVIEKKKKETEELHHRLEEARNNYRAYEERLKEIVGAKYKKYPGWGIYTFPVSDGLPRDYTTDGKNYFSFDQDFFEVLPEKEKPCWGYVTQWGEGGRPTKVALVLEVVEKPK